MADVKVNIVNGSGQKVTFTAGEDSDFLAHLTKQYRAGEFESLEVVKPKAAVKPAADK